MTAGRSAPLGPSESAGAPGPAAGAPGTATDVVTVVCAGCGYEATSDEPFPIRCPRRVAGDDIDHVMTRRLDLARVRFAADDDPEPFVRYRELSRAWHLARAAGWSDDRYVELVRDLDRAVAAVDGGGFRVTPFGRQAALSDRLGFDAGGGVWVKDETGNVSGSHKARHLMGVMLELLVEEATGRFDGRGRPLAIASCGNAALAAGVVARAAGRPLDVFVPTSADPVVVERLHALGARVAVCPRRPGLIGDPTVHRLAEAIDAGAIPFTCQGDENGLTIEGGETLGYEMAEVVGRAGVRLDRVIVQVGGGALASAVGAAFAEALALGVVDRRPRLDTVQTAGGWPLRRAWERVVDRLGDAGVGTLEGALSARDPLDLEAPDVARVLAEIAHHRSSYMWPWPDEPHSVAHGILDDETYDWLAVVRSMLATGGRPLVVDEPTLREANELASQTTGIDADHTGTAGLAGLLDGLRRGDVRADETVAVLFTGARRASTPAGATPTPHGGAHP